MGKIRNYQLNYLKKEHNFTTQTNEDGEVISVTFLADSATSSSTIKVTFEDYFITGFDGFDFHNKWNNGIAPYDKVMYGTIDKETPKMYYFNLEDQSHMHHWEGWCPKKSCTVLFT